MEPTDLYITGSFALNMRPPDHNTGDWHPWGKGEEDLIFYCGKFGRFNTNEVFNDYGIYDASYWLNYHGIEAKTNFAANHQRAVLDLVYFYLLIMSRPDLKPMYFAIEDYFDDVIDTNIILELAENMLPYTNEDQKQKLLDWIHNERYNHKNF